MRLFGAYFVVFALIALSIPEAALACWGYHGWSTGEDISKLRPGEIVVRARLVDSYNGEQPFEHAIMGPNHGMVYQIRVTGLVGGAADNELKVGSNILVLRPLSVCEVYEPRNFSKDSDKTLVLQHVPKGIFYLVGGRAD